MKQIKIKNPLVRFFLDRYNIILNPFGSAYPEENIKELPVLKTTLDYILNGGLFVNVADIPFYWAYDTERSIRYDLVKQSYQYIPFEYETKDSGLFSLKSLSMQSFGPFTETPFVDEVKVSIINTEKQDKKGEPILDPRALEVKDSSLGINSIDNVAIHRAVVLERKSEYNADCEKGRIESVVKELDYNGQSISPIFYVNFGEGKILSSLVFLGYNKKSDEAIVNLLCKLILKEVKRKA